MKPRYLAIAITLVCFSAHAQTSSPSLTVESRTSIIPVQGSPERLDGWRSLKSLDQFPFVGPDDCSTQYGYVKCGGTHESTARDQPPTQPAPKQTEPKPAEASTKPAASAVAADAKPRPAPAVKMLAPAPLPERRTAAFQNDAKPDLAARNSPAVPPVSSEAPQDAAARELVKKLLILTFDGRSASDRGAQAAQDALKSGAVAGILIRSENIETMPQLRQLTAGFNAQGGVPKLVMIDGAGITLRHAAHVARLDTFPAPRVVGAAGDALAAFELYRKFATELSSLGIAMDLGAAGAACPPDAPAKMDSCFGTVPVSAAAFGTAFNLAHQDGHVLTAMRHRLSSNPADIDMLREMIKRKAPDALVVGSPDQVPLGREAAAGFVTSLREARYTGAIIFDLSGISVGNGEVANALAAGADMLILRGGEHADAARLAVENILSALKAGSLVRSRLESAAAHADALRATLVAWSPNGAPQGGDMTSSIPVPTR